MFGVSLFSSIVTRYNSVFKQEIMAHRWLPNDRRGLEARATSRTREEKTGGDEEEIQEERKLAELQQDAVDAGHSKKSERLDWMYKGSLAEGTRLEDTKFTRAEGEEEPEELKRERERREDLPPERPNGGRNISRRIWTTRNKESSSGIK